VLAVNEIEKKGLHNVKIDFENDTEWELFAGRDDTIDVMRELGYLQEYKTLTLRQVAIATLAEFLQFIYEALKSSEKGKLSVTYTLFRKPFKEILLLWEWMIIAPSSFLDAFEQDSNNFDLTKRGRWQTIKEQLEKLNIVDKDTLGLVFDLRFVKDSLYGFEGLWNKSIHLVTNQKHYKTESFNFNFIFSDRDSKNSQWEHIYTYLPTLMIYTIYIYATLSEMIFDDKLQSLSDACEFVANNSE
jgi:hypothetical protein